VFGVSKPKTAYGGNDKRCHRLVFTQSLSVCDDIPALNRRSQVVIGVILMLYVLRFLAWAPNAFTAIHACQHVHINLVP
jgi:hypothetical protein